MELIEQTWDDQRLKRDRLRAIQEVMKKEKVGGLYLTEIVNVRYAINVRIPGGHAFVPAEGEPIAFVRPLDEGYVSLAHSNMRKHIYRADPSDPEGDQNALKGADKLLDIMGEYGVRGQPLGIDTCDPVGFNALHRREVPLMNAEKILALAKTVKTADEILIYKETAKLQSAIMRVFRDELKPGINEREMINLISGRLIGLGAEGILQINICSGENMNPWRRWPTSRKFQDGDFVGMDLHTYGPGGYIFDASRTYLCGTKASDKQRDLYRRAYDYNNAVIELFKPGVPIAEIRAKLPKVPEKYQKILYSFHIAHSNGLTPGEYPSLMWQHKPLDDVTRVNQVLSVDCVMGEEGDDLAVKLEEQILITPQGPVKMADMPYEEKLLN
jgi:Xaa-Pro aminopeptidase